MVVVVVIMREKLPLSNMTDLTALHAAPHVVLLLLCLTRISMRSITTPASPKRERDSLSTAMLLTASHALAQNSGSSIFGRMLSVRACILVFPFSATASKSIFSLFF